MPPQAQQLQPGQVVGGDFRVVRPLAEGGMGAVYLAEQDSTGKKRALKVMHVAIARDKASVQRFVREAQVGARIESEHVVEVIAAGVDADTGIPWLAMELLEGGSLAALVQQRGPMPAGDVLRVFEQLGHALVAAHRAGIVHRDLKPENVFVASSRRSDSSFTVKVLDFGIAKLVAGATSATNSQLIGSPLWMAPEQMEPDAPIAATTDVWALGLIAFYLLTGRFYWVAANRREIGVQALVREIAVAPLAKASARAAELGVAEGTLPPAFDAWFARTVVREAPSRFASVEETLAALRAALSGAPELSASTTVPSGPPPLAMPLPAPVSGTIATAPTLAAPPGPPPTVPIDSVPRPVGGGPVSAPSIPPVSATSPAAKPGASPRSSLGVAAVVLGLIVAGGTAYAVSRLGTPSTSDADGVASGDPVPSIPSIVGDAGADPSFVANQSAEDAGPAVEPVPTDDPLAGADASTAPLGGAVGDAAATTIAGDAGVAGDPAVVAADPNANANGNTAPAGGTSAAPIRGPGGATPAPPPNPH